MKQAEEKLAKKEAMKAARLAKKEKKKKAIADSQLDEGVSPSASSMPMSSHPLSSKLSQLSMYNIEVNVAQDDQGDVLVINSSP